MYELDNRARDEACQEAVELTKAAIESGALSDSVAVCSFLEAVFGKLVELRGDGIRHDLDDEYSRL